MIRSVTIKGDFTGEAVLCTGDKTFALKQVETTNTVFLVQVRISLTHCWLVLKAYTQELQIQRHNLIQLP